MSAPIADARALLRKHGLSAKKSWGQNFLIRDDVFAAIVDAVSPGPGDWVVEIGAGLGTLTARLAQVDGVGKVVAIEKERDMLEVLHAELGGLAQVEIRGADAARLRYRQLAADRGGKLLVCGNLPYQITAPILSGILAERDVIARAVVMVQREVADRLLAPPGDRNTGALSVIAHTFAKLRSVRRVGPGAFYPPPKVDSAVIAIEPRDRLAAQIDDEEGYRQVVRAAFSQRRKTLRNALRSRYPSDRVDRALAVAGVDGTRRGETLSVSEFAALAAPLLVEETDLA